MQKPSSPSSVLSLRWLASLAAVLAAVAFSAQAGWADALARAGFKPAWRPEVLLEASPVIQAHLLGAFLALAAGLTAFLLPKRARSGHKWFGWTFVTAMALAAGTSFFIRHLNDGGLSFIHGLSAWTLMGLPLAIWAIRRGNVRGHRRGMMSMLFLGVGLAGLFAFAPGRLMHQAFFGG